MKKLKKVKLGRPPLYKNPKEMVPLIEDYFNTAETPTVTGLALALGLTRQRFSDYINRPIFTDVLKAARERIELFLQTASLENKRNCTMSIFLLKNHFGYSDKQDVTVSGELIHAFKKVIEDDTDDQTIKISPEDAMDYYEETNGIG